MVLPTLVCVCVATGEEIGQEKVWGSDSHVEDFGVKGREKVKFVFVFYLSLSINLVIFFSPMDSSPSLILCVCVCTDTHKHTHVQLCWPPEVVLCPVCSPHKFLRKVMAGAPVMGLWSLSPFMDNPPQKRIDVDAT